MSGSSAAGIAGSQCGARSTYLPAHAAALSRAVNNLRITAGWPSSCRSQFVMRARLLSLAIHFGGIALLLMVSTHPTVTPHRKESVRFNRLYLTQLVAPLPHHGGGGGGER